MRFVLIFFFCCCFSSSFAQNKMLILNEKTRELCVVNENQWVRFKLDSVKIHHTRNIKGYLLTLNDTVAKLVMVRSFFHSPSVDTVFVPVKNITHVGLYEPIKEPLVIITHSLIWTGVCLAVTASISGGVGTFLLVGLASTPVSLLSEYGLKKLLFPVYPLKGKRWHRVSEAQLNAFLLKQ